MKALESGQLVIELNGIIGECAMLAMQCVRDSKAGKMTRDDDAEAYEHRTKRWRSIFQRVKALDNIFTRSSIATVGGKN